MNRSVVCLLLVLAAAGCTRGSGGSPSCGLGVLAGPSLITSQLANARAVLTDPPRGIPDSLPARVIEQKAGSGGNGAVIVGRDAEGKISMQFRGPSFPARGDGLLGGDDTSQRAVGGLFLDQGEPPGPPPIRTLIRGSTVLELYRVRGRLGR